MQHLRDIMYLKRGQDIQLIYHWPSTLGHTKEPIHLTHKLAYTSMSKRDVFGIQPDISIYLALHIVPFERPV